MKTLLEDKVVIRYGERVPVFPLPNAILFPHVELPLHIFEPRYRKMLRSALKGNNLLVVSLLQKEWETHAEPYPCHEIAGVGYVKISIRNSDGTSNIILKGIKRVRITEFLQTEPYRVASIAPLETRASDGKSVAWQARKLSKLFVQKIFLTMKVAEEDARMLERVTHPEELADLVAFTLSTDFYTKQRILETLDLGERLEMLIPMLESELMEIQRKPS